MRKFTYWVAEHLDDNQCYSLIGKTKREVNDKLAEVGPSMLRYFGKPIMREIPYTDLFDFFEKVTDEGGGRACGFIPGTNSRYKD